MNFDVIDAKNALLQKNERDRKQKKERESILVKDQQAQSGSGVTGTEHTHTHTRTHTFFVLLQICLSWSKMIKTAFIMLQNMSISNKCHSIDQIILYQFP